MSTYGKVNVWVMTEDERLAYIAKHPIIKENRPKGSSFSNMFTDYKWRGGSRKKKEQ